MSTPVVRAPGEGEVLNIVGDVARILVDSEETGGACVIFELTTAPGQGPPLHRHRRDDEHFFVLAGTARFVIDGREILLGPGGFAKAPRGSVHAFTNPGSTPLRMLITCTPGGLEAPFREAHRLSEADRRNPAVLSAIFAKFDVDILGPPLSTPGAT